LEERTIDYTRRVQDDIDGRMSRRPADSAIDNEKGNAAKHNNKGKAMAALAPARLSSLQAPH
jgi:hypothetical protein